MSTTVSSYINLVNDAIRSLAKLAKLGVVLHAFQGGAPPVSLYRQKLLNSYCSEIQSLNNICALHIVLVNPFNETYSI